MGHRRLTAEDHARQDVERGDLGAARRRLESYLATKGYDADMLARLGHLALEMRDPYHAGRYWLLSGEEGDHVAEVIDAFVASAGKDPSQLVAQLPRGAIMAEMLRYPRAARERIERLGLAESIIRRASRQPRRLPAKGSKWISLVAFVIAAGLIVTCGVGGWQILFWIFGGD